MRVNDRVIYCGAEWFFIEEVDGRYLLHSINKNINDVLAEPQYVKKFEDEDTKHDRNDETRECKPHSRYSCQ